MIDITSMIGAGLWRFPAAALITGSSGIAWLIGLLAVLGPLLLVALALLPDRSANAKPSLLGSIVVWLALWNWILSLVIAAYVLSSGALSHVFVAFGRSDGAWPSQISSSINQANSVYHVASLGVYIDSLTVTLGVLVSFIGWVVARYSIRYLDGDRNQGRFLKWVGVTLGSIFLVIVSRNLLMLAVCWMMTSWGLHHLLTHCRHRPEAIWVARQKFLVSRLGDAFLWTAIVLTYLCFGSLEYESLFAAAEQLRNSDLANFAGMNQSRQWLVPWIGILLVLGAMTKSAQFPFHGWLPDTMETPTPVSALMHAGIINAGGFLIIRLSPLVSLSQIGMDFLACIGATTALMAAVIMLTQTSIKRSLAFSTVAQMGFMMLQCGLGAFAAALLHIVAHSLYKAHAFLSCGSILDAAASTRSVPPAMEKRWSPGATLGAAAISASVIGITAAWLLGVDYAEKPGGIALGLILVLATTHLLWSAFQTSLVIIAFRGILQAVLVSVAYLAAFRVMDALLAQSVSYQPLATSAVHYGLIFLVCGGFLLIFALQAAIEMRIKPNWLGALYVHASNGFYLDIWTRRLTRQLWRAASAERG